MSLLKKLINKRIGLVVLTIIISIFSIVASLWWNAKLGTIINMINENTLVSTQLIITAVISILSSAGSAFAFSICSAWTCETIAHDLRMGYAKHFSSLPITEIEDINAGGYLSKLQNEMNDIMDFLHGNLFSIMSDFMRFLATFSWLLWINRKLTLLAYAPVVLLIWYTVFSSKIIGSAASKSQHANTQMSGFADTLVSVFPVLKLFNASVLFQCKYNTALEKWETAGIKEERKRAKLMSLSGLLSCIPLLLLFLIGGTQVMNEQMTLGTLYVFINLSGNISGVMMNMPGRIAGFRRFAVNMKRMEPLVLVPYRRRFNEH